MSTPDTALGGPLLFARFAYPPNSLGYCGPDTHSTLLEYANAQTSDGGLDQLAAQFSGAWPYLQLIATATGIGDPLDHRVVEAYWIGTSLLDRIDMSTLGHSLKDRFEARAGSAWTNLAETIPAGATPNHAFHVFSVYPWVGMLKGGPSEHPLRVLDRCRIRWGRVITVDDSSATVEYEPLVWTGSRLELGPQTVEQVTRSLDGYTLGGPIEIGDWVAMHWDWICTRLDSQQLARLKHHQARQLTMTNDHLTHSGPAVLLG
jgi:hypothetical protein